MNASGLLGQALAQGVTIYRSGARLRWRSPSPIPDDLLSLLRRHRVELLRLAPDDTDAVPKSKQSTVPSCAAPSNSNTERTNPWRVVIERCVPVPGPIRLNAWTTITDPEQSVRHSLIELEIAVAHRNVGRHTIFTRLVDEYLQRLAACGCDAHLESVA